MGKFGHGYSGKSEEEVREISCAFIDVYLKALSKGFCPKDAVLILVGVLRALLRKEAVEGSRLSRGIASMMIELSDELEAEE